MTRLGSRFRATREERGSTLDDIAARTKIPRRLLVELEQDDFTHWPTSRVYRIGYLQAYAAAVGLDTAQVIAQFDAETGVSRPAAGAGDEGAAAGRGRRPAAWLTLALAGGLLAALLIGLALSMEPSRPAAAQTRPVSSLSSDIALEPAPAGPSVVPTSGRLTESTSVDGELQIDSIPSGTRVVVNGIARGATPVRLRFLPIGSYTIRLVRDGYESGELSATLTSEQPVRSVSITLRARE
jgi:cytoskeletal protein RodZ